MKEKEIDIIKKLISENSSKEPQNREYMKIWEEAKNISEMGSINVDSDWQKVKARIPFKKRKKALRPVPYFSRVAAILVFAIGLAIGMKKIVGVYNTTSDYISHNAIGVMETVVLPDNSTVILKPGSSLNYSANFNTTNRDVILTGEAYFQVQRNENIAFKVFCNEATVEVLGTAFNLKSNEANVELDVTEGKVSIYGTEEVDNKVVVMKNEHATYHSSSKEIVVQAEIEQNNFAWRTGELNFEDTPLSKALQYISAAYGLTLKELPEITNTISINAKFEGKPVEEIVEFMDLAVGEHKVLLQENVIIFMEK